MTDDKPEHKPISVLWFNRKGSGPDEMALQLNPQSPLMDGETVIAPATLGLMVRAGDLVIVGAPMVGGGFLMAREQVADLHQQLGAWLAAHPDSSGTSFTISSGGLSAYAGAEEMGGRLRAPVSRDLLLATCDRRNHELGDEDKDR